MCLAIPGKIKKIDGCKAYFDFKDCEYCTDVSLIMNPRVGDWILIHDGRALSTINESEAEENLQLIKQQENNHHSHNNH